MNDINVLKENGVDLEKSLELLEDMGTYDEIMSEFLKESSNKRADLKKYAEAGDLESYGRCAHSLKSDARYLGFTQVAEKAIEHEMESKDGNIDFVHGHVDDIINEVGKMVEVGRKYLVQAPIEIIDDETPKESTILVVDDSDLIRTFIYSIFNSEFNVVVAEDGSSAITIIENDKDEKIKAVFLDLNMPNVNGFGVLDYFNEHNLFNKYPVSIITGVDDKDLITRAFKYNIVDMLQKPFTEKDVKRIVERTIRNGK